MRGNPGHHPILPEPEPRVTETVPEPPEYLGPDAQDEWRRLAPELHVIGLLTVADLHLFAFYCEAYGVWRDAGRNWAHEGRVIVVEDRKRQTDAKSGDCGRAGSGARHAGRCRAIRPDARRPAQIVGAGAPKAGKFDGLTQ